MPEKSRKPQLTRAMSIAGVVLVLSGGALGASGAPWWVVLLVIIVIIGVAYLIGSGLQLRADSQDAGH